MTTINPNIDFDLIKLERMYSYQQLLNETHRKIQAIAYQKKLIYIGKTHVPMQANKQVSFSINDPMTWNPTGIQSRWNIHKRKEYGSDGMTIILLIPTPLYIEHTLVTPFIAKCSSDAEECILKLERDVQLKYKGQCILWNNAKKYKPGRKTTTLSVGYILYVAYKLQCSMTCVM